jgi:hypothetical protein
MLLGIGHVCNRLFVCQYYFTHSHKTEKRENYIYSVILFVLVCTRTFTKLTYLI